MTDALLSELKASIDKAKLALDRTLARLEAFERERPRIETEARALAEAEFSSLDPRLFAELVQQPDATPGAVGQGGEG